MEGCSKECDEVKGQRFMVEGCLKPSRRASSKHPLLLGVPLGDAGQIGLCARFSAMACAEDCLWRFARCKPFSTPAPRGSHCHDQSPGACVHKERECREDHDSSQAHDGTYARSSAKLAKSPLMASNLSAGSATTPRSTVAVRDRLRSRACLGKRRPSAHAAPSSTSLSPNAASSCRPRCATHRQSCPCPLTSRRAPTSAHDIPPR